MISRRPGLTLVLGLLLLWTARDAYAQAATPAMAQRQTLPIKRSAIQQVLRGVQSVHVFTNGRSLPIDAQSASVQASPGDLVYGAVGGGPVPVLHDGRLVWQLPWRIWPVAQNGSLPQRLRIDVEIEGVGLSYIKAADRFSGTIQVGVVDEASPSGSNALPTPVRLALLGTVDAVDPASFSIPHTSIPFSPVHLDAREPAGDSVTVRIRTDFDAVGHEIRVPVVRPRVRLRVTPDTIDGFGLESATLLVIVGSAASTDSVSVTLVTPRGHLEQEQVRVRPNDIAKVALWSRGTGSSSVTAETPDQFRDSIAIDFQFPTLFLLAILVGGACGSAVRQFFDRKDTNKKFSIFTFLIEMAIGVLAGGLVAVMHAVGIPVLKVFPKGGGEAAVAVIAAIAAILGAVVIDRIKGVSGGTEKEGANADGTSH